MTAHLIDGKAVAASLTAQLKTIIQTQCKIDQPPPGLAVIVVGNDPASLLYVHNKRRACEAVGIRSFYHALPAETSEAALIELIQTLNAQSTVQGILLQLPLPSTINTQTVLEYIHPSKDVDGFHPYNLGRLAQRKPLLRPCTPQGIILLLDHIQQPYKGKHAVIVGASNIVGRPMALELLIAGSTVTICHRFTDNLAYFTQQADILIVAVGKPHFIKGTHIKPGATVVDVGITRLPDGSLVGDVVFDEAKEKAAWITPVPGGVGPMTVAVLLKNTLYAAGFIF